MRKLSILATALFLFLHNKAQHVGIGTNSPNEKLEVNGNLRADTIKPAALKLTPNAGNGKVLTSDAAGNATWQSSGNTGFGVWGDCATNGNISEYNPVTDANSKPNIKFGFAVAISGNYAVVGAPNDYQSTSTLNIGSVSFYRFDGANWQLMSKHWAASPVSDDKLGSAVAISGNFAVVGKLGHDGAVANQGAAIIYKLNADGNSWSQDQTITDLNAGSFDDFGKSVSIDGNQLVVGASGDDGTFSNQGSAVIYEFNGTSWVQKIKLIDADGGSNDNFGTSVSINANRIIVGAPNDDVGASANAGSACIFEKSGTVWNRMVKVEHSTANEEFGGSVSISGNYIAIGIPRRLVGTNANQGAVKFMYYDGVGWYNPITQTISRSSGASDDYFGYSVYMSGNYAIIGNYSDDVGSNISEGSVVLYQRIGNYWQQQQFITDPSGNEGNDMGFAVALDAATKRFVIGAPGTFGDKGAVLFGKVN